MKFKIYILFILHSLNCYALAAQLQDYSYRSALDTNTDQWHKISLPDYIFRYGQTSLNDLRIFGFTSEQDTVEVPYYLEVLKEELLVEMLSYKEINNAHKDGIYYFGFQLESTEEINEIDLDFGERNFDWKLVLEGSNHLKKWYTILEDYRILSINNGSTNFDYTTIKFPNSKYRYYRIGIPHTERPDLLNANLKRIIKKNGESKNIEVSKVMLSENKKQKETEIILDLKKQLPVSSIEIQVVDQLDYHRPIVIYYLTDSIDTEMGWKYNYNVWQRGTLSSLMDNIFSDKEIITEKLKITIKNNDNEALQIGAVELRQNLYQLIARFTKEANYFLYFGNEKAKKPIYDIVRFKDSVPENLSKLKIEEHEVLIIENQEKKSFFENKFWIWGILILVVLVLGLFTLSMIKGKA